MNCFIIFTADSLGSYWSSSGAIGGCSMVVKSTLNTSLPEGFHPYPNVFQFDTDCNQSAAFICKKPSLGEFFRLTDGEQSIVEILDPKISYF